MVAEETESPGMPMVETERELVEAVDQILAAIRASHVYERAVDTFGIVFEDDHLDCRGRVRRNIDRADRQQRRQHAG